MKRLGPILLATLLLAGCGQTGGVHQAFEQQQFPQVVAEAPIAHGESAKTRHYLPHAPLNLRPPPVPLGKRIVLVPPVSSTPGSPQVMTWPQWAVLLLDRVSAPRCANNLVVVVAWAEQENTTASWNPLATTYDMPGSTLYNSAGVKNYASLEDGLAATVGTLRDGFTSNGYGPIVNDLRACAAPVVTASAINASDWCRGCAGGAYVFSTLPGVIRAYVASLQKS